FNMANVTHLHIPAKPIVLITSSIPQEFEFEICKTKYKTKKGLTQHQSIFRKYNICREGLYVLPPEAIGQFKKDLLYIIGSRLKEHFTQSGRQSFSFLCLE
ncbi:32224_t:CDS:1, partial [Racocetra persica]